MGVGVTACSDDDDDAASSAATSSPVAATATAATLAAAASATSTQSTAGAGVAAVDWRRVALGSVSACILVRGGEAAIVDTSVSGSGGAIEQALPVAGVDWDAVGHVILTHRHGDHVGSLPDVLGRAASATAYAGAADIPSITAPQPLVAVGDGDSVFDLEIIETPGHTAGHISVLDRVGGLLVAGDALNGGGSSGVTGPNPRFSGVMTLANASAVKLGGLQFETIVFGHSDPLEGGAYRGAGRNALSGAASDQPPGSRQARYAMALARTEPLSPSARSPRVSSYAVASSGELRMNAAYSASSHTIAEIAPKPTTRATVDQRPRPPRQRRARTPRCATPSSRSGWRHPATRRCRRDRGRSPQRR